jgi:hypothetical protein
MMAVYRAGTNTQANTSRSSALPVEKWAKIDANENGDVLYIDRLALKREGSLVEYWAKIEFAVPRTASHLTVLLDKYVANCAQRILSHRITGARTDKGQVLGPQFLPEQEQTFVKIPDDPKHPEAIFFRYVCNQK